MRENARINGQSKVINQVYIGSPQKVLELAIGEKKMSSKFKVEEFGSLWLAQQADRDIDLVNIIDEVIPKGQNEKGPSVGEYFLYCVWNRMVDATSKNKLARWYKHTAIQQIRPVEIGKLTSQRYWDKWDRVTEKDIDKISRQFFDKIWQAESPSSDCLLFDTTNYYTFMASHTDSELAKRGRNKEGRHNLRQVGLGLLVSRESKLPLYYKAYPGNLHDARLFEDVMDEMFGVVCGLHNTKERLTVVVDKGMNADGNYSWIDENQRIHFVTSYSPYFAKKLASFSVSRFEPVDTEKNRRLQEDGKEKERLLAYRTKGDYWGKERSVVVTYNPATARKKDYTFQSKLDTVRDELLKMRKKVRDNTPHWREPETIRERYLRLCERFHISSEFFQLEFEGSPLGLVMNFRKDPYKVEKRRAMFGKNIIITDNTDWTTSEIVDANLSRWEVEDRFRQSKDDDLVGIQPIRHWTDSKIRCHLFSCVVAMTYLRRIELKLAQASINRTADDVIEEMRQLHSVLEFDKKSRQPVRHLEEPTKTQYEVLKAFDYGVNENWVLQPMRPQSP